MFSKRLNEAREQQEERLRAEAAAKQSKKDADDERVRQEQRQAQAEQEKRDQQVRAAQMLKEYQTALALANSEELREATKSISALENQRDKHEAKRLQYRHVPTTGLVTVTPMHLHDIMPKNPAYRFPIALYQRERLNSSDFPKFLALHIHLGLSIPENSLFMSLNYELYDIRYCPPQDWQVGDTFGHDDEEVITRMLFHDMDEFLNLLAIRHLEEEQKLAEAKAQTKPWWSFF